jgi:hypothetical protein
MKLPDNFQNPEDAHLEIFDADPKSGTRKPEDVMLGYFA